MKNRVTLYVLLVLVLVIWSLIFIRFSSLRDGDKIQFNLSPKDKTGQVKDKPFVDYKLILDYDDPFLCQDSGKFVNITEEEIELQQDNSIRHNSPDTIQSRIPSLTYYGTLSNTSKGRKVGFLTSERQEYMIVEGDSVNGMKVLRFWNDSVRIAYQNQIFHVKKYYAKQ